MKRNKKIILVILIVLICFFCVVGVNFMFSFKIYKVGSDSMEPTIKLDSIVLVKEKDKYNIGDIIIVKEKNNYFTNRVSKIDDYQVVTKSDKTGVEYGAKNIQDIVGKVEYVINKKLFLVFVCICLCFIIFIVFIIMKKEFI